MTSTSRLMRCRGLSRKWALAPSGSLITVLDSCTMCAAGASPDRARGVPRDRPRRGSSRSLTVSPASRAATAAPHQRLPEVHRGHRHVLLHHAFVGPEPLGEPSGIDVGCAFGDAEGGRRGQQRQRGHHPGRPGPPSRQPETAPECPPDRAQDQLIGGVTPSSGQAARGAVNAPDRRNGRGPHPAARPTHRRRRRGSSPCP